MKIGDKKVEKWRTTGLVVKENLLTEDELAKAHSAVADLAAGAQPGTHRVTAHPFADEAFNGIAQHPEFLSLAERALNTSDHHLADAALVVTAGPVEGESDLRSTWQRLGIEPGDLVVTIVPMLDVTEESGPIVVRTTEDEPTLTAPAGAAIVLQGGTPYRLGPVAEGAVRVLVIALYAGVRLTIPHS